MRKPALCVFSVLFKRNKIIGKKDIFNGEDALVPPHRSVLRSVACRRYGILRKCRDIIMSFLYQIPVYPCITGSG